MNTYLITGAAGFIGVHICEQLSKAGHKILALDALVEGLYPRKEKLLRWNYLNQLTGVHLCKFNLASDDFSNLNNFNDIKYVINLAAMPGLAASWKLFDQYVTSNIIGTERLASWIYDKKIEKFIHISTSSVYGTHAVGNESSPLNPVSPYGVTKLAAEGIIKSYRENFGLPSVILRYFSVYGPHQRPDMAYRRFINSALKGEAISIFGDGSQSRTNSFVTDIARWTLNSVQHAEIGEEYNLSGSRSVTLLEAVSAIENILDSKIAIKFEENILGDQKETKGDITKSIKSRIWDYETDFIDGLRSQINWQKIYDR